MKLNFDHMKKFTYDVDDLFKGSLNDIVDGVFYLSQSLITQLKKTKGSIVNIA